MTLHIEFEIEDLNIDIELTLSDIGKRIKNGFTNGIVRNPNKKIIGFYRIE